jgi:hypothetical protein
VSNFDEALERFHLVDLEYGDGLANHGPMGAEALEQLGHQALIPAFVGIYVPRLQPLAPGRPIGAHERDAALGDVSRRADWIATYEAQLAEGDWRAIVATELPELLPGLFAGAGHGWLRVAHAIRALEARDEPLRRRELARGLAYWAARYQTLPGLPGSRAGAGGPDPEGLLAAWPRVGEPTAREGLFLRVVDRLETFPAFVRTVERVPAPDAAAIPAFITGLCRAAARLYLAHPESRVAYVHALTIPSALRLVLPYLDATQSGLAALYTLQAVGALDALFGERRDPPPVATFDGETQRIAGDWDEIRYHAACSIQEHSIKMVEACWREDRIAPDPVLALAAADAALSIDGRRQPSVC